MSLPTSIKLTVPLFLSFSLLAACGGGGGFSGDTSGTAGTSTTGTSTTTTTGTTTTGTAGNTGSSTVSSLRLTASSRQLLSDGSQPITISALAKDSNNTLLADAGISFSVDNEADLPAATGATYVTAELTPGVPKNRQLTVTATAGSVSESILIDVVGTTATLNGPSRIAINAPTDYTLKVADAGNAELGYQVVSLPTVSSGDCSVSTNEMTTNGEYQTDSTGEFSFQVTGNSGGTCEISVSALGATDQQSIDVSGDVFTMEAKNTTLSSDNKIEVNLNSNKTLTLTLANNGNPQTGEIITLSSTRGDLKETGSGNAATSVTTDNNGEATFDISSNRAGSVVITATTSNGLTAVIDNLEFVATDPAYLITQADPSLIQSSESSTIVSKVRDFSDNPVKNQRVLFSVNDVVNGVLSSSEALTDSLGRASVVYTAGNATSEKDGVIITTSLANNFGLTDIVNDTDGSNTIITTLTVGGEGARIALGGDNLVGNNGVFYTKNFGVIVTDNAGNPIAGQKVDFKVNPIRYYKGQMVAVDTDADGKADKWAVNYADSKGCPVEDLDYDGASDVIEDINQNGKLDVINEDYNNNGILDVGEDFNSNGVLDLNAFVDEDLNHNGYLDTEDLNRNGVLDVKEDLNNNLIIDTEDTNGNGVLDTEDTNGNNVLDAGEDTNGNGVLDTEDTNGNDVLDTEDLNGNGVLDADEDLNGNGILDTEDLNGNGYLDTDEDLNKNGVLDSFGTLDEAEDINHNGKLDPTNAAAVLTTSGVTGEDGSLTISIQYNKSEALWSAQRLTATTFVKGSEYIEQTEFVLDIAADDVSDIETSAPNQYSPYGQHAACTSPY